jgi:hypothetical protein
LVNGLCWRRWAIKNDFEYPIGLNKGGPRFFVAAPPQSTKPLLCNP